jgi:hypothetical protein
MPQLKFFAWLLLVDHLNTRDILRRRHLNVQSGINCVLCTSGAVETRDHERILVMPRGGDNRHI